VVDHAVVAQAMRESDVLVNIGNTSRNQLPSKVVEYAALGKPVINIAQIEGDSSTEFFGDYPKALSLMSDSDEPSAQQIKRAEEFIAQLPTEDVTTTSGRWTEAFEIGTIASAYQNALDQA
jgi:hypothetical protein